MTISEIQQQGLEILKDVHAFCVNHNIKYSLYGGTMIGAIRHKGFIPWDDDIDIAMMRNDYELFLKEFKSKNGYQLFHAENSGALIGFARVCEMKHTESDFTLSPWNSIKTGVWIDVFPLDNAPDDINEAIFHTDKLKRLSRKLTSIRQSRASFSNSTSLSYAIKLFVKKLMFQMPWYDEKKVVREYISECQKFNKLSTKHFSNFSYVGFGIKEYQVKEVFEKVIEVDFEGGKYLCCNGYDRLMRSKYGDYMQLPPVEKRITHHPMYNKWK